MTPPDSVNFRRTMGLLPTGVTVVSAIGAHGGPSGATANAVTSLSLQPPMMLACMDRSSRTLRSVQHSRRFGINVLAKGQEELAQRFARRDPEERKWNGVSWTEREDVPMLDGAALWVACSVDELHDGGDHMIVTGEVLDLVANSGAPPLVFHQGAYRSLG